MCNPQYEKLSQISVQNEIDSVENYEIYASSFRKQSTVV